MIISASRRTDIPSFFAKEFVEKLNRGYTFINGKRISLLPEDVDCIVFWTKNPIPLMKYIGELKDYNYYFQFTVTGYNTDVETNVPSKGKVIIPTFKKLSRLIGKEKVIWRYDPILLTDKYTKEEHYRRFTILARELHKYTEKCIFSYFDFYSHAIENTKDLNVKRFTIQDYEDIAYNLSKIAKQFGLKLETCAEMIDLDKYDIGHAHCIDADLIEKITGKKLNTFKDPTQRKACGCCCSIDVGKYDTCKNGCKYCYANKCI